MTTVLALVKAGLGVSVIPESFGINRFQGIRAHHFTDKAAAWTVLRIMICIEATSKITCQGQTTPPPKKVSL